MLLLFTTALWARGYNFDAISCSSVTEAQKIMPNVFLEMGISLQTLESISPQNSFVHYRNTERGKILQFQKQKSTEAILTALYPHHVRIAASDGWYILDTQRVLFAQTRDNELHISTEKETEASSVSIPSKGCAVQTNRKFSPYLPRTEIKNISIHENEPIVELQLPLLSHHTQAHRLFSKAKYLRKPSPLPISLSYAPITVQLNFSPMYWMYHSAFPLQEKEYTKLFSLDPFASGTLVIFDMQHGAPEIYPTLIAIPFKGIWPPKKATTDNTLKQLFEAAQFHYRKGEDGYLWREWEIVPVDGGIIISRSKRMLKEALSSLKEEKSWPLLSTLQQDFFSTALIGMHYKLEEPAKRKKIQINDNLPRELSLTLSPIDEGWQLYVRSDLKGRYSLPHMLNQSWFTSPPMESPLHPIAYNILSVAGNILVKPSKQKKYLTHKDLVLRKWVNDDSGLYSVHPSEGSFEVHYCSHPKAQKAIHFTWVNNVLYSNPKPCDL